MILADSGNGLTRLDHLVDLVAKTTGCGTQMGFQYLTNVHTGRNTQWVQYDINRITEFIVRHVFHRHDDGDNTLVTVTTSHLVTRLNATLDGKVDLNDFENTWCHIVTSLEVSSFCPQNARPVVHAAPSTDQVPLPAARSGWLLPSAA